MRLNGEAKAAIRDAVAKALSGPCTLEVPAPNRQIARRLFEATTPHVEQLGGAPMPRKLMWALPNGSAIRVIAME